MISRWTIHLAAKRALRLFDEKLCFVRSASRVRVIAIVDLARSPSAVVFSASITIWCFPSFPSASFALSTVTIVSTGIDSSQSGFSYLSIGSHRKAYAARCLTLARCRISNLNLDKLSAPLKFT